MQLQESLALADELQLNNLRATILLRIAKQLASGGSSWASPSTAGMLEAAQLVGLSQANLCLVLGALSAALKHTKPNACSAVLGRLPQAGTVAKWGRLRHGATGDFTWEGEGFDSAAGDVDSPPFTIGGEEWKLRLYPKGDGEEAAGHASLYLMLASPPSQGQTGEGCLSGSSLGIVSGAGWLCRSLHHPGAHPGVVGPADQLNGIL